MLSSGRKREKQRRRADGSPLLLSFASSRCRANGNENRPVRLGRCPAERRAPRVRTVPKMAPYRVAPGSSKVSPVCISNPPIRSIFIAPRSRNWALSYIGIWSVIGFEPLLPLTGVVRTYFDFHFGNRTKLGDLDRNFSPDARVATRNDTATALRLALAKLDFSVWSSV
jgi:hypothetical protein